MMEEGKLPEDLKQYGDKKEQVFTGLAQLKGIYGDRACEFSPGAIGVFNYTQRIMTGLQQFLALNRKFSRDQISRDDIFALTREAAAVSGIKHTLEMDREEIREILDLARD